MNLPIEKMFEVYGTTWWRKQLDIKWASTIQNWRNSGHVPAKWQRAVLRISDLHDLNLSYEDLLPAEHHITTYKTSETSHDSN